MTRWWMVFVVGLTAVGASGCSKKAKYEKLCARIEAMACEEATLGFSAADRMTIVVSNLAEESGAYKELFDGVAGVPPAERKQAIVKAVSDVTGAAWSCPAFDGMWDAKEPDCSGARKN